MKQEVYNFWRVYSLLKHIRFTDSAEQDEYKGALVREFTRGRTTHLREMTHKEYDAMCDRLAEFTMQKEVERIRAAQYEELKRQRSVVLHLMQRMGVDTTDWARVDALCLDRRIAGKVFRALDHAELESVEKRLRAIERKTMLKPLKSPALPPSLNERSLLLPDEPLAPRNVDLVLIQIGDNTDIN